MPCIQEIINETMHSKHRNVIVTDCDGAILFCNDNWLDTCKYRREDIYGKTCKFLQCFTTDAYAVRKINSAIRSNATYATEIDNVKGDGTFFRNLLSVHPLCDGYYADIVDLGPTEFDRAYQDAVNKRRSTM